MPKKILIVDDSALMRRILCDIIASDERLQVADTAVNGQDALKLLQKNSYDLIVLDLLMPVMDGISFLKEMNRIGNDTKVVVSSVVANKGSDITVEALSLGAVDFVKKPEGILDVKGEKFSKLLLHILTEVIFSEEQRGKPEKIPEKNVFRKGNRTPLTGRAASGQKKIVAIASSTGGPKALQAVLPYLPENLDAPVLVVQHMPVGFTETLAQRLDSLCKLQVVEAKDGDTIQKGYIYIAKGGIHMTVSSSGGQNRIAFLDEPPREGVKPCANYMYESLQNSDYEHITCAVLTGMGADGTKGIANLGKNKKTYVIAQNQETCAVYGMPRSVVNANLADEVVPLQKMAESIIKNVGVRKDGC
jgi:two-component system chemotaxis response regulator CheB